MTEYSERDLILPALDIIKQKPGIATSDLIVELMEILVPNGVDLEILAGRSDTKFSQKVRNLVSHHTIDQKGLGYIHSEVQGRNWYHTITPDGENYLKDHFNELPEKIVGGENIEGLDAGPTSSDQETENLVAREYPIDSVLIRNEQRTVYEIMRRIKSGTYILDPDFQREFVWDEKEQSRLIESVLMRIPLPVFYLAEREDGKIVVVDGLQRLLTFNRFIGNELSLRLPKETSPNIRGKRFTDLPTRFQQRIEDTQLIVYLIDPKVPERVRLDIFERVNSGKPLSRQQMRNSIYMGEATRWLKREANSQEFLKATGGSLNWRTMRDREVINRFCAFYLAKDIEREYKGDMDDFLASTLVKMNQMKPDELEDFSKQFRKSMVNNYLVFGQHAFRRHKDGDKSRSVINVALFDVFSVLMTHYSIEFVERFSDEIHQRFFSLIRDQDFNVSITLSTNSVRKVMTRFDMAEQVYKDLHDADSTEPKKL
jgi:hypothetical protein